MRIRRLDLLSFGPFSGERLDFGEAHGLFLVLGSNEAGKSSALRGLTQFLYGMPQRSQDAFLHDSGGLAVGGVLEVDGRDVALVRKKRRKNDLVDSDGEPFEQEKLTALLGGVGEDAFRAMFGLGHETLTAGGEEILRSGGAMGQSLFAAASGIANLRAMLSSLEEEHKALFAPRATVRALVPAAMGELKELRREQLQARTTPTEWKDLRRKVRKLEARRAQLQEQRETLLRESNRLERFQTAFGPARLHSDMLAELDALGQAPDLSVEFTARRSKHQEGLAGAQRDAEQFTAALEALDQRLGLLQVDEALAQSAGQVDVLYCRADTHAKARSDAGKRKVEAEGLSERALVLIKGLRPGLGLERAEELLLPRREQSRIRSHIARHTELSTELRTTVGTVRDLERELAGAQKSLDKVSEAQDTAALAEAVERAAGRGDLDARLVQAVAGRERQRTGALEALAALGLWDGPLEDLGALAVPSVETMRRYERQFVDADAVLTEATNDERRLKALLADKRTDLDVLHRAGEVPSEDDLSVARTLRDEGWTLVRARLEGAQGSAAENAFVRNFNPASGLSECFEAALRGADTLADRLRREAGRVAKRAGLESEAGRLETEAAQAAQRCREARAVREVLAVEWAALWQPQGITALPPREMQGWDETRRDVLRRVEELRGREAEAQGLVVDIAALCSELRSLLAALGEAVAEGGTMVALLAQARRTVARHDGLRSARRLAMDRVVDLTHRLDKETAKQERVQEELSAWRGRWAEAVQALGLGAEADPDQAQAVLDDVNELSGVLNDLRDKEKRIRAIRADYEAYAADVAAAVTRLAPDLVETEAVLAAGKLFDRLSRAQAGAQERKLLAIQRDEAQVSLDAALRRVANHEEGLRLLCAEARCQGPEGLEEAEGRSRRRAEAESRLAQAEERLAAVAGGADLAGFAAAALDQDPDALAAALDRVRGEAEAVQEELTTALQDLGGAQHALAALDGTSQAALLAERAQGVIGKLQSDVDRYVRLKLASLVVAREIERYRRRNQGPILERASGLFADLTCRSFSALEADFDNKGDPVLMGVREDEERVPVVGMSDGTKDQLYLALRLASIFRYLDNNPSMPFVVDDILVHFDDARAEATLHALATLAQRTQVVFFSHHEHLLPLARRAVPDNLLTLLRLGAA